MSHTCDTITEKQSELLLQQVTNLVLDTFIHNPKFKSHYSSDIDFVIIRPMKLHIYDCGGSAKIEPVDGKWNFFLKFEHENLDKILCLVTLLDKECISPHTIFDTEYKLNSTTSYSLSKPRLNYKIICGEDNKQHSDSYAIFSCVINI